jgi:hypothetical protein
MRVIRIRRAIIAIQQALSDRGHFFYWRPFSHQLFCNRICNSVSNDPFAARLPLYGAVRFCRHIKEK